jgi:hypothetical protein
MACLTSRFRIIEASEAKAWGLIMLSLTSYEFSRTCSRPLSSSSKINDKNLFVAFITKNLSLLRMLESFTIAPSSFWIMSEVHTIWEAMMKMRSREKQGLR